MNMNMNLDVEIFNYSLYQYFCKFFFLIHSLIYKKYFDKTKLFLKRKSEYFFGEKFIN